MHVTFGSGGGGGGGAPSGAAGGDLGGTYPNPTVVRSPAQLPAWTYTAGAIGDGLFTTDSAAIESTSTIVLSTVGLSDAFSDLVIGSNLVFTNESRWSSFRVTAKTSDSSSRTLTVTFLFSKGGGSPQWEETPYALMPIPSAQTSADVGLGSVNNTSDADKPVSTAQQTALDLKETPAGAQAKADAAQAAAIAQITIAVAEAASSITPVADNTYTIGLGVGTNGTITVVKGIITAVTEATP